MGIFKSDGTGVKGVSITDPKVIFTDLLRSTSGATLQRILRYNIFYQIVSFKGIKDGVGTSTIVANTALAMAKLGLSVCVIDTSILSPSQDYLLKTDILTMDKDKIHDWFDMGFTKDSVLHLSTIDKRVSVLSFYGRTVIDLLSTGDNSAMVELALSQLSTKFDIILIDLCHEPTNVNTTCMQLSHKMIQVWSNGEVVLRNVENFIKNNIICSCSMDKMRNVITSMTVDSIPTDWEDLFKKFHFKHLSHVGMSSVIAELLASGKVLYGASVKDESVQEFNDCIVDVVCHLLDITEDINTKGKYSDNIIDGGNNKDMVSKLSNDDYPELRNSTEDTEDREKAGVSNRSSVDDYIDKYGNNVTDTDFQSDNLDTKAKRGFFKRGGK